MNLILPKLLIFVVFIFKFYNKKQIWVKQGPDHCCKTVKKKQFTKLDVLINLIKNKNFEQNGFILF